MSYEWLVVNHGNHIITKIMVKTEGVMSYKWQVGESGCHLQLAPFYPVPAGIGYNTVVFNFFGIIVYA